MKILKFKLDNGVKEVFIEAIKSPDIDKKLKNELVKNLLEILKPKYIITSKDKDINFDDIKNL